MSRPLPQSPPARPLGVALLAIAHWLLAALFLPIGLIGSGALLREQGVSVITLLVWAALVLMAVVQAAIGLGLWRMRRSSYQLTLALYGLALGGNLASGIERGWVAWAGILICIGVVISLWRQRKLFR